MMFLWCFMVFFIPAMVKSIKNRLKNKHKNIRSTCVEDVVIRDAQQGPAAAEKEVPSQVLVAPSPGKMRC